MRFGRIHKVNRGRAAQPPMRLAGLCAAAVGVLALAGAPSPARAAMSWSFAPVDNSTGGTDLTDYVTQDLLVTTDNDWTGAELLVTLDQGDIYQNPGASDINRPTDFVIGLAPSAAFDTYLTGGADTETSTASVAGGAVDLGGSTTSQFDAAGINITWFNTAMDNVGNLMLGRFTLSDDAAGTWQLLLNNKNAEKIITPLYRVRNGVLSVPEPGSLTLLALAGGLLIHRRRHD